mmetsp:Transcript_293/g.940  ORF Transcript_293/g.940 Transcript_293/m.940 type:complete len:565 (+) Transcript_293:1287-2981(+)
MACQLVAPTDLLPRPPGSVRPLGAPRTLPETRAAGGHLLLHSGLGQFVGEGVHRGVGGGAELRQSHVLVGLLLLGLGVFLLRLHLAAAGGDGGGAAGRRGPVRPPLHALLAAEVAPDLQLGHAALDAGVDHVVQRLGVAEVPADVEQADVGPARRAALAEGVGEQAHGEAHVVHCQPHLLQRGELAEEEGHEGHGRAVHDDVVAAEGEDAEGPLERCGVGGEVGGVVAGGLHREAEEAAGDHGDASVVKHEVGGEELLEGRDDGGGDGRGDGGAGRLAEDVVVDVDAAEVGAGQRANGVHEGDGARALHAGHAHLELLEVGGVPDDAGHGLGALVLGQVVVEDEPAEAGGHRGGQGGVRGGRRGARGGPVQGAAEEEQVGDALLRGAADAAAHHDELLEGRLLQQQPAEGREAARPDGVVREVNKADLAAQRLQLVREGAVRRHGLRFPAAGHDVCKVDFHHPRARGDRLAQHGQRALRVRPGAELRAGVVRALAAEHLAGHVFRRVFFHGAHGPSHDAERGVWRLRGRRVRSHVAKRREHLLGRACGGGGGRGGSCVRGSHGS